MAGEVRDPKPPASIAFPQNLFLDRRSGKYCFGTGPDRVLVVEAGQPIGLEELRLLFHPYGSDEVAADQEMFHPEVLPLLVGLFSSAPAPPSASPPATAGTVGPAPRAPAAPPAPPAAPRAPAALPSPPRAEKAREQATAPSLPSPAPAAKVEGLREEMREQVFERITSAEGQMELLAGRLDGEIQSLVTAICREVTPRQLIAGSARGRDKSDTDFFMDHAMAGQAFGVQLALEPADLFLLAKSAILQSLTEADRKNIQVIKQSLLLGKPSPSFCKRLSHYYQEISNYLRSKKAEATIVEIIQQSKFLYFPDKVERVPESALALGIADAFVSLQEAGKLTLEILRIIPERLLRTLKQDATEAMHAVEALLRDTCYSEFHRAIDSRLSGGDHCDFFPISPTRYAITIFDVSGHEEQASRLRDVLVKALQKVNDFSDPARVLGLLNRFTVQYPFPEEVFVSMVYGVLDIGESRFVYSNAGHHPPYLVRQNALNRVENAGGLALNLGGGDYQNGTVALKPLDCLVLYTDGLTEAAIRKPVRAGRRELFGHGRLENVITTQKLGSQRAKRAVESILAAVQDQGFQIEDDITIQVYRHI